MEVESETSDTNNKCLDIIFCNDKERVINGDGCGSGSGCVWCQTFIGLLCCPCLLLTFILGHLNKLIFICIKMGLFIIYFSTS